MGSMQSLLKYGLVFCAWILLFQSCNIINPTELTPTYIHIDSFHLNKGANNSINYSANVTTIWVYYNNGSVGVFDLPATFPVLATGNGTLEVSAGVKMNGLESELISYPFYSVDTFNFNAQPGKVITHNPSATFYSGVKVTTLCSQYNIGLAQCSGTVGVSFVGVDSLLYNGQPCAGIFLNNASDSSIDSSTIFFNIDQGSAFVELNYKSTIPFYIGLQATINGYVTTTPYYLTGVYPNDTWQKFYLDVGGFNAQYKGTNYKLYIKANLAEGQTSGKLLLGNIQLVQF